MFIKRSLPPLLVSCQKVWDYGDHNAFTDLIYAFGRFYLSFRESDSHEKGQNGIIRILTSSDGTAWEMSASLEVEGLDLRDPKLSVMPDGRLLLLCGAVKWDKNGNKQFIDTLVAFGNERLEFGSFTQVLERNDWLWQLTWHQGIGYGVSYQTAKEAEKQIQLWETEDGLTYKRLNVFKHAGKPNETVVRILPNGTMILLNRRNEPVSVSAMLGAAIYPYQDFVWKQVGYYLGGPNFLVFSDNELWAAGRLLYLSPYHYTTKTALIRSTAEGFHRELILPSSGDTGYPGLVFHDGYLWVSYYSSHEGKAAIYVAKVMLTNP